MKPHKRQCIIDVDLESLIKKIDNCKNNPEKSSATKIGEPVPCGYSMSTIWAFDSTKYKHTLYRAEDCMKKFCISHTEHAADVINFEKKKMLTLTKKERCRAWYL